MARSRYLALSRATQLHTVVCRRLVNLATHSQSRICAQGGLRTAPCGPRRLKKCATNWHVRQLFGYDRIEDPSLVLLMNEIYRAYWNPLLNFFTPVLKLKSKERINGRVKKIYDEPRSPYKRLLENTYVPEKVKAQMKDTFKTKNSIYLKKQLDEKLKEFYRRVDECKRIKKLTGSWPKFGHILIWFNTCAARRIFVIATHLSKILTGDFRLKFCYSLADANI